jgi:hypothetical protein
MGEAMSPLEVHPRKRSPRAGRAAAALLLAAAAFTAALPAQGQEAPDPSDYRRVSRVPRQEFDRWLKEQVRQSGGDFDRQRYRFIVGFSTGHYGSDPVHAIAMRRLAFSLLNNTCAAGDRVRPVAWEMKVWKVGAEVALTAEPASRAAFVDDVPYAPEEGSRGGHDTERALYDTLTRAVPAGEAPSTIVLLLTNSNQSQGPTGERASLFGANNRRLASAISERRYRSPSRHSFTAYAENRPLTLDVTALFPARLRALPGSPSTPRYPTFALESWQPPADQPASAGELPNRATVVITPVTRPAGGAVGAAPAPEEGGLPWPLLLGGLLVLALGGGVLWLLLGRKPAAEKTTAAAPPKGRPLPGSVLAVIGTAPAVVRVTLSPLTTESRWHLAFDGGALKLSEEAPEGAVAQLYLDDRRRLAVKAEGDTILRDQVGHQTDGSTDRLLLLAPGGHVVCRVTSAGTAREPVRLELTYQEKS